MSLELATPQVNGGKEKKQQMRDLHRELMGPPHPRILVNKYWEFYRKPGSILVGRVKGYTFNRDTGERTCMVVQPDKGKLLLVTLSPHPHLRRQLDNLSVRVGDRIGIKYLGIDPDTRRHEFHVLVDR